MMTRRLAVILILCGALLEACGGRAGNNVQAPAAPADNAAVPAPASNAANSTAAADATVTAAWLTGRWADNPACNGQALFTLGQGGQYAFVEERGRWSLAGSTLTIEITAGGEDGGSRPGDRHTTQVSRIGPDEAEFVTEQNMASHVYRCR